MAAARELPKTNLQKMAEAKPEGECRWFIGCTRPATTTVNHPILGDVPCCEKCADFAADK